MQRAFGRNECGMFQKTEGSCVWARKSERAEGGGNRGPEKELDITPRAVRSCRRTFSVKESP